MDNKEQVAFFERLKDAVPSSFNLAQELADILETSVDSIYRRMRGQSALTYSELLLIQRKLNLKQSLLFPIDSIEEVTFVYARPAYGYDSFLFLQEISNQMELVHRRSNLSILLSSDDLPFFLHFLSPALLQFKLMVFSGDEIHDPENPEEQNPELINMCTQILKRWLAANSKEVWGSVPLDSTLKQILYSHENHLITDAYAVTLLEELRSIVEIVRSWCASGKKQFQDWEAGDLQLFHSELNTGEMNMLLGFGSELTTYKSNYGYGYLKTEHPQYCYETQEWINDLASKGMLISLSAEKYRNQYINLLLKSIDDCYKKLNLTANS
ncbi:MAG: hypothetical protein EP332_10715 [Bacteroidetes bacterium]|nr:MAG: hypothetical protein EP332_10715 [Bacteroidota bacterium]